jgi:hypothetical protein
MSYKLNNKNSLAKEAFQKLFLKSGKNIIIPFEDGMVYPDKIPHIGSNAQRKVSLGQFNKEINKKVPDFALLNEKGKVFLVRTIYQRIFSYKSLDLIAQKQQKKWPFSWIFLISIDKIYFDNCPEIIKRRGYARLLDIKWIDKQAQEEYLAKIKEF